MLITIAAIGRMKAGPEQELLSRYVERTQKSGAALHFQGPNLIELAEARNDTAQKRKELEAEALLAAMPSQSVIIALDERGKSYDSPAFANLMKTQQDDGCTSLCFAIGGPDGHGEALKKTARLKLAFGAQTWPHQIARILLAEQIYRATTILSGHPYHRS